VGNPVNSPGSREMGARLSRERKTGGGGSAPVKETKPGGKVIRESECLVVPRKPGNGPDRTHEKVSDTS
jgi:hypothetical protein